MHHCLPAVGVVHRVEQEHLRGRTGIARPEEAGAEDARGVERDRVTRRDEVGQVGEMQVTERPGHAIHNEEAAPVAPIGRVRGDPVRGRG